MWEQTEENEMGVDLTPFIDPLVVLAGLMMILMPTIESFHIEKSHLVQNGYGAESQSEDDKQILLEFTQQTVYAKQENREYYYDEIDSLITSIPPGSTVLLAGDAACTYQKSLQLKSALSTAGFQIQELSIAKGEE